MHAVVMNSSAYSSEQSTSDNTYRFTHGDDAQACTVVEDFMAPALSVCIGADFEKRCSFVQESGKTPRLTSESARLYKGSFSLSVPIS